ncbi:hypothetical protein DY000_02040597 [Brassica cretica]|uniref:YTH domain-containing family protein n=1 Tax=Brassica cretica TaxID=69181 RepID=A0ABQ7BP03_BRACR|nr:hypothetical protein DY000_02040597 [Brassica cretica]
MCTAETVTMTNRNSVMVKTTNTTLQYPYLERSDSSMYSLRSNRIAKDSKEYKKDFFSNTYTNAKLFVIKSYSEDDIHKSIKYNVWSSTSNGNKKLNAAYNEAAGDKSSCPVFLIFSMAEYWQQDKWVGCFPVKCHIVKDIPNSSLRHITLENNENKPVTNSRDTQEVREMCTAETVTMTNRNSVMVKTTNTTLQYPYLERSDSSMYSLRSNRIAKDSKEYKKDFFSNTYTNAKLFVIKSYSEDDIHKSIKYNVWSSTSNGNKKLNAAYNEAAGDKSSCPVFLIFSMAEYWQQDKWVGCFPVKCHIVKDIPNSSLRHITLENNENKPVTNSRDTQEVKIEQGVKVIKIFKEHVSKTCILNDFVFYENCENIIKDGKKKHQLYKRQQSFTASDKNATPKDKSKETSVIAEVAEEISQNGVAEVASTC